MFVPVSIKVGSDTRYDRLVETSAKFDRIAEQARNMREPLNHVAEMMHTFIAASYATQGANGATGKWVALSPEYGAWKAARSTAPLLVGLRPTSWVGHRGNPPGQRRNPNQTYAPSGVMMRQMLRPTGDPSTWQITTRFMRYTPQSDIAGFHEWGTEKMPARPPVDLNLTFLRAVDREFLGWLVRLMDRSGFAGVGSG